MLPFSPDTFLLFSFLLKDAKSCFTIVFRPLPVIPAFLHLLHFVPIIAISIIHFERNPEFHRILHDFLDDRNEIFHFISWNVEDQLIPCIGEFMAVRSAVMPRFWLRP